MRFDLSKYEPVEDRIRRFYKDHPEGRIMTDIVWQAVGSDERVIQWVVKATLWAGDPSTVVAQGHAEEVVGSSNVNKTSALENCETSAIGRALANYNYAPKGARPSREEMTKAQRPVSDAMTEAIGATRTLEELEALVPKIKDTPHPEEYHAAYSAQMRRLSREN